MTIFKLNPRPLLCACALITLGACTPSVAQHGNMLQDYQIQQVAPGVHSRTDVLQLLGSPTTQATFDENVWYYIGRETEKRGILDPEVTKERVIVVAFDEEGIVQHVAEVDGENIDVPFSRDKTPTHGSELTFMQQLLGNLGRFNPQEGSSPTDL